MRVPGRSGQPYEIAIVPVYSIETSANNYRGVKCRNEVPSAPVAAGVMTASASTSRMASEPSRFRCRSRRWPDKSKMRRALDRDAQAESMTSTTASCSVCDPNAHLRRGVNLMALSWVDQPDGAGDRRTLATPVDRCSGVPLLLRQHRQMRPRGEAEESSATASLAPSARHGDRSTSEAKRSTSSACCQCRDTPTIAMAAARPPTLRVAVSSVRTVRASAIKTPTSDRTAFRR
jgi:hypothetical protein